MSTARGLPTGGVVRPAGQDLEFRAPSKKLKGFSYSTSPEKGTLGGMEIKHFKSVRRAALFVWRCIRLRSVSRARWVDAYENAELAKGPGVRRDD